MTNQRKHPRVKVRVVASFDCYNEDRELFSQKMGVILEISLDGMLIETDDVIDNIPWLGSTEYIHQTTQNKPQIRGFKARGAFSRNLKSV